LTIVGIFLSLLYIMNNYRLSLVRNKILYLIVLIPIFLSFNVYSDEIDYSEHWKETLLNDTCFIDIDSARYRNYDFSYVLSNIDKPLFIRRRYIGIFDPKYRRIEFFLVANRDHSDPYKYIIQGKSKLGENIRPIKGSIKLLTVRQGEIEGWEFLYMGVFSYELKEPGTKEGDGVYKGILSVMFMFDADGMTFFTPADGSYSKYFHMFVGVWERYNSNVKNKCIFSYDVAGLFMKLPYCEEFIKQSEDDWYVYEIKDKFKQYGWSNYGEYKECWWK